MLRPAGPEASGACGSSGGENAAVSITRSNESRSRHGFSSAACAVVALAGLIVPASIGAAEASKRARVEFNRDIRHIFPYRDYVIDSFNRNKPFDQFTVEQLAGDLLPHPTTEQLVATGFNRLNMMTREGGAQPGEYLAKYASDRVPTVAITWLGSTMGCVECHDHKYDPFTSRDFYSLAAFFADIKQWGVYQDYDYTPNPELRGWSNDHPFPPEVEVESPYLKRRQEQLREQIRQLCSGALARAIAEPRREAAFEDWAKRIAAFVPASPTGWTTPTPTIEIEKGARLQPDGSVLLLDPADKAARTQRGDAWSCRMKPGNLSVARIRLELLPHAAHGGKLARDNAESASVRLSASVCGANTANEKPLAFFHAEADFRKPRYFNGYELPGVLDGWQTAKDRKSAPQTAIFALDTPVELTPEVELKIVVQTDRAGCIRLSLSSLGFDPQLRDIEVMNTSLIERDEQAWASQADGTRFVVPGVSWRVYKTLVEDLSASSPIRVAYDGRNMELMVRGPMHHRHAKWIDRLIMAIADELEVPIEDLGETTWQREQADRGIEADLSYFFVPAKIEAVREAEQRESNKVDDYPDPDLVVEVDISPPQVDREGIYATLKVPEVWLFDGQVLTIWRLRPDGRYAQSESSELLGIRADQAARWLIQEDRRDRKAWTTRLATWVRGGMTP